MRGLLSAEITGPISTPSFMPVADLAFARGCHHALGQCFAGLVDRDRDGSSQAALPGASECGVGQNPGGHFHVGIRQNDDRILRAALALRALAVGRRAAIDIARSRRGADETDRFNRGMIENRVDRVAAAVHELHDALREPGGFEQLEQLVRRQRHALGWLQQEAVSRSQRVRHEPERNHDTGS